jgi:hypothetical protein
MHLNFDFTAGQILWTFSFAALLVLLVVLMGRDRVRLFPWFTASITLTALRLLTTRLLFGRMAPFALNSIFIILSLLGVLVSLVVLVELARHAFSRATRLVWINATGALLAAGAAVLIVWGPWPAWKAITADSSLATLRLLQLVSQKTEILGDVLAVGLGLLVVFFGRRFNAGWRSHTQQILIGLSTAAITQVAILGTLQVITPHVLPRSQAEYLKYQHILGLQGKLLNANSAVFLAVIVWWIVCLWINEPGTEIPAATAEQPTPAEE